MLSFIIILHNLLFVIAIQKKWKSLQITKVEQYIMEEELRCWAGSSGLRRGENTELGKENSIQSQRAISRTFQLKCKFKKGKKRVKTGNVDWS